MTGTVTELWRHPIKGHGREPVTRTNLKANQAMPFDRLWGLALGPSKADGSKWVSCANFHRISKNDALMAIEASLDEEAGVITLTHPDLDPLTFAPDTEGDRLVAWVEPLLVEGQHRPVRLLRAERSAFTDSDFPSVTLCNLSSHRAVEQKAGRALSRLRWRGNVWIDGLAPWEEFDWIDRELRVGTAILRVEERTDRCNATHANPDTGRADVALLDVLDTWGHRDFSVRARVIEGGEVAIGDTVVRV